MCHAHTTASQRAHVSFLTLEITKFKLFTCFLHISTSEVNFSLSGQVRGLTTPLEQCLRDVLQVCQALHGYLQRLENPAGSVTISTSFQGGTRSTSWFLTIVGVQAADVKTCQHLGFENTHQHMRAPRGCSVPQYHGRKQTGPAWLPRHRISKASMKSE